NQLRDNVIAGCFLVVAGMLVGLGRREQQLRAAG
ncbi:MAG: hypothetical protein QOI11_2159, partial [Candidatus Eremiobacteraeota bacterium]|nr:hypothetical protein [Candidatus Eremiobacteraeota bacterium]